MTERIVKIGENEYTEKSIWIVRGADQFGSWNQCAYESYDDAFAHMDSSDTGMWSIEELELYTNTETETK